MLIIPMLFKYAKSSFSILLASICLLATSQNAAPLFAQEDCDCYRMVPQTVYEQRPITVSRVVNETVFKKEKITTYKPVWTTEKRERVRVSHEPVTQTSEREETYRVFRPLIETKYREREVSETAYETTTEVREEKYRVQRPVTEVEYCEEQYRVKRPVTERFLKTENITTYKPINIRETALIPGVEYENRWVMDPATRRLRWLPRGCYIHPTTGQVVYKRPGLHWLPEQRASLQTTARPTLNMQEFDRTAYVPETQQRQTPVDITKYVDEIQTRKYPVQVQRMQEEMHVVKVPYKVHRPVTRTKTERIPYEQVTYKMEEHVRKVPVTKVTWERVEEVTPYERQVCRWVAETKEIQVPQTIQRTQDYQITETIPRRTVLRLPMDIKRKATSSQSSLDSQLAIARRIETESVPTYVLPLSEAVRMEDYNRRTTTKVPTPKSDKTDATKSAADKAPALEYYGTPIFVKERGSSILIKENQTSVEKPKTGMTSVRKPTTENASEDNSSETSAVQSILATPTLNEPAVEIAPPATPFDTPTAAGPTVAEDASDINDRPTDDN